MREKQAEYARSLTTQRRVGALSTRTTRTVRARVPLASTSRGTSRGTSRVTSRVTAVQSKENLTRSSNLVKRSQPSTSRKPNTTAKRPRAAVPTSRPVSRQTSKNLSNTVEDSRKKEYLELKKKVQQLEENAKVLVESLQETECELVTTHANLKLKTSEHSEQQAKQIQLEGERERLKLESQQNTETTNMLQESLKNTKERFTLQLETEQAKYEALSYAQNSLKEQHSATSSRLADTKRTIATQESKFSANQTAMRELNDKLDCSISNTQANEKCSNELAEELRTHEAQIKQLEAAARKDELTRRQLHDCILDLKGTVRVFIRVYDAHEESGSELFDYPDPWRAQTLQINPSD